MNDEHDSDEHDGLNCQQCQAASQACAVFGGFAESMEKMLADGVFYRMGRQMAEERERRFLEAYLK